MRGDAPRWGRVLLKLSGEILAGGARFGLDPAAVASIASEIASAHALGVQIGLVVGGGNIFRGARQEAGGIDRVTGDHMGMLATVINALALQSRLEHLGVPTRVQTAFEVRPFAEPYIRRRAVRHMEKGRIVVFAGGTGSPFFSTDTAAALRAAEIEAGVLLKGTKVDGVYDRDPEKHPDAVRFDSLSHGEALRRGLGVMDAAALALCRENGLPIIVFDVLVPGSIRSACLGGRLGTLVHADGEGR
ncbi:MAG: UMP kinase [Myxococcota bacterium]|nr:UMP kinase [Myxococcota bacterium]